MNAPVAVLRGVSKRLGRTLALAETDLDLGVGVIGLLGPNGAGKTTLLRLLATALAPSSGSITVAGHSLTGSLPERTQARRRLGYLPQEVSFPRRMSTFDFLDYIAVLKEWSRPGPRHAEVRRVLELVDLAGRSKTKVHALSGGQRRRLAIAQALMGDPALVVLDEPTTGLDPEQRASLRGLLSEQARHSAVVLATHQTEDVAALCDRVIVLDSGRVCFDDSVVAFIATASGRVMVGPQASEGALSSWRTGTGEVRSVGGVPHPLSREVEPAVEDAYLLMRAINHQRQGVVP